VAHKRCFVVVVEMGIGDRHPFRSVVDVHQAVVEVLAVIHIGREVAMVYPDITRSLNADPVSIGSKDLLTDNVADDNVLGLSDEKSNANKLRGMLDSPGEGTERFILEPLSPIRVLFEPIRTFSAPVMVPGTTTMAAVSPLSAATSSATVVTVMAAPPAPPVVLSSCQ